MFRWGRALFLYSRREGFSSCYWKGEQLFIRLDKDASNGRYPSLWIWNFLIIQTDQPRLQLTRTLQWSRQRLGNCTIAFSYITTAMFAVNNTEGRFL